MPSSAFRSIRNLSAPSALSVDERLSQLRTILILTTRYTQLVGCTVPLQQAAIGGLSNPRLPAAVANAGGLGMVSVYGKSPAGIAATFDELRVLTSGIFGANFIMRFVDPAQAGKCIAAAAARVRVVEWAPKKGLDVDTEDVYGIGNDGMDDDTGAGN